MSILSGTMCFNAVQFDRHYNVRNLYGMFEAKATYFTVIKVYILDKSTISQVMTNNRKVISEYDKPNGILKIKTVNINLLVKNAIQWS